MFQVDRPSNRLQRLEKRRFADLNLRERDHLQEWLANQPDALGEDLLIIQKEFDGFADTRERLDLLALDKEGQLVIIENKLDDSGRDVTWQALKYTAYVSSLTKAQIVDIYQQYLDRYAGGGNAAQNICDFLETEELDEVTLNPGYSQRLMFIAANFRKEVTATVLWLREHQIDARCFKVTPWQLGEEILIDIQPVIPTQEAADFMIGMAEKESEAKTTQGAKRRSHAMRLAFWPIALEALRAKGLKRYEAISPSKDNWINCGSGLGGAVFNTSFTQSKANVGLVIASNDKERNKEIFDALLAKKVEIEVAFGKPLDWDRLDHLKMSWIGIHAPFDGFNRDVWPDMSAWIADNMALFQAAFEKPLADIRTLSSSSGADV